MSASSRGPQAVVPLLKRAPQICTRCATLGQYAIPAITRRAYSSAPATSSAIPTNPTETSPHIMPVTTGVANPPVDPNLEPKASRYPQHEKSLYRIKAGVILSRPPILTREQTDFESAFYLYQKRLNERLSTPFSRQFFFRKGQPAGIDFSIKWSERGHTMAREIGRMTRSGKNAWDDELLMDKGGELADPDAIRERMYIEAESRVSEDGETLNFEDRLQIERPLSRETEADRTGDVKRLDRKLDRTLYLVVKDPNERWVFPQDDVSPGEGLDETAARALTDTAGINMNTWMVGRHPIAYEHREPIYKDDADNEGGRKLKFRGANIFYLKGRIMAGQADLTDNKYAVTDFKWLTKEELQEHLGQKMFASVEKAMPAQ